MAHQWKRRRVISEVGAPRWLLASLLEVGVLSRTRHCAFSAPRSAAELLSGGTSTSSRRAALRRSCAPAGASLSGQRRLLSSQRNARAQDARRFELRGLPSGLELATATADLSAVADVLTAPLVVSSLAWLATASQLWAPGSAEVRALVVLSVWAVDCAYSFGFAPGQLGDLGDLRYIIGAATLSSDGSSPALFTMVFFFLGIWPAIYCATLLPGAPRQRLPTAPFVWSSFVMGAYSLSPYLALRELRAEGGAVPPSRLDFATRWVLESKVFGLALVASCAFLGLYGLGDGKLGEAMPATALATLWPVYSTSRFVHLSCLDFVVLWAFFAPVLLEDGRRRGRFLTWSAPEVALFALCAGLPCLGGSLWLAVRPGLEEGQLGGGEEMR